MKQDKFLTGILVGVVVLVIIALGVFFLRDGENTFLTENTPEAVVLNYVLALQTGEYQRAYGYLAEEYQEEPKPSFAEFRAYFSYDYRQVGRIGVRIISVDQEGDQAWVRVETVESGGGLFNEVYRSQEDAILIKDEAGEWRLAAMPYQFWGWDWYGYPNINR
jgi:hypothetical protein